MNIFTGVVQSLAIGKTLPDVCGLTCSSTLSYSLTVTGGPSTNLITIPIATTASVEFAPSSNLADVGTYTLAVVAQYA